LARALYSASILDLETVACFLALYEIKLDPKNTADPGVDLLSFGHPAQSALKNALIILKVDLLNGSLREVFHEDISKYF
jgi:hypothetical protein